jgi:4-hydroxyphenylpyruvate dioxygenase
MGKLLDVTDKADRVGPEVGGVDYVELYVGNPVQAAHFYRTIYGFSLLAYSGLETGRNDQASYVVGQGNIRLVLTGALHRDSPVAQHVHCHSDGVRDIALSVEDAASSFDKAVSRGARPIQSPTVLEDEHGKVTKATIASFGDTVHSFVQRHQYKGIFLPGYQPFLNAPAAIPAGLAELDHIAISTEKGELGRWASFYKEVLGFHQTHQEDISTEYSGMNSKVLQSPNGRVRFPMQEPIQARRRSQIEEYLDFYGGPGVQHLAFLTHDIGQSIESLKGKGVEFLRTPGSYYDALEARVGKLDEPLDRLRNLNVLVDTDQRGYLLQVFGKPIQSRPTLFIEIIQRKGAVGFGAGNIKALFEAMEREQQLRGTL